MFELYYGNLEKAIMVHRQIPEFDPAYIQSRYVEKKIASKNPYIIICRHDAADVGYMIGYDAPDSMYLWLNGTLPDCRKKGVFRLMLDDLVAEAKRRGHTKITVKSYERFNPMLNALANAGFHQTGREGSSILLDRIV